MREYILKLNDRNLQRKKASGITNYVMYSLLVLIILKLFNTISEIDIDYFSPNIIELIWYSSNFALATYYIHVSFKLSFNNSSSIRILKYSKNSDSYFIYIMTFLMLLFPILPGITVFWNRFNSDLLNIPATEIPLIIVGVVNIIIIILILIIRKNDQLDVFKETRKTKNNAISLLLLITSVLIIATSIYCIVNLNFDKSDKLSLFIATILCFALLVLFEKIIDHYKYDIFIRDLENLEYEVYVKNLEDDEIRKKLQKNYMGFLTKDYLDNKEIELEEKRNTFEQVADQIEELDKDLINLDKQEYPIEFYGRNNKIELLKEKLAKDKKTFYQENEKELREIIVKDPSLTSTDLNKLKKLLRLVLLSLKEIQ